MEGMLENLTGAGGEGGGVTALEIQIGGGFFSYKFFLGGYFHGYLVCFDLCGIQAESNLI